MQPEEIFEDLLRLDPDLGLRRYWGERSLFYNPGNAAPLGVIVASIKDHDGENDRSAKLDREGVYRFALGVRPETYRELFGPQPPRPPKGGVVGIEGYDPTTLGKLMPHPVYAWMSWLQILNPTGADYEQVRPLVLEALDFGRAKWQRRSAA
jgi:hypothetical protein